MVPRRGYMSLFRNHVEKLTILESPYGNCHSHLHERQWWRNGHHRLDHPIGYRDVLEIRLHRHHLLSRHDSLGTHHQRECEE